MGGFALHELLPKLRVRVTAIHQHGDSLYVGTATGAVQVYSLEIPNESGSQVIPTVKLLKTHQILKRPIDQIGVLGVSNQVVILSDTVVTAYPADFSKGCFTFSAAKSAHTFATSSYTPSTDKAGDNDTIEQPVRRDLLVIGCKKKVLVYGAGKSIKDPWELSLQHSPRTVIFPSAPTHNNPLPETIYLLYSPSSSVILYLNPSSSQRLSISELGNITYPPPHGPGRSSDHTHSATSASVESNQEKSGGGGLGMGMGALSGLGGYVGFGGKAAVPVGTRTVAGEVIIVRNDLGVFYSTEGSFTRDESLHWTSAPEAIAYSHPYIYALISDSPSSGPSPNLPIPTIHIHLSPTLTLRESIPLPTPTVGALAISGMTTIRNSSITPAASVSSATRVLVVSTPTDKNLGASEGSSIWAIEAGDIGDQIDELVLEGRVLDAIGLAEAVGDVSLSPKRQLRHLKKLYAVQQFARGQYQEAMDTFLIFNVNPALIIALFPAEMVSGRLHVHRSEWMELFGAVSGAKLEPDDEAERTDEPSKSLLKKVAGMGLAKKTNMETLRAQGKDDEAASIISGEKDPPVMPISDSIVPRQALEALMFYLSDRRQKLTGAITALPTPLPAESTLPSLSSLPGSELHQLPSIPMTELEPEQLLRTAQVIYTALIKVYLVARPVLVGSLCRIENWCDVEEVEELLKEKKKFSDLIDLYHGKKMHKKALAMLHELAKDEDDKLDRYPPTVRYLQKLGPGELDLILDSSRWIFKEDPVMALQIFTADEPEVEALPRKEVVSFLEKENVEALRGFLEHIITDLGEEGSDYHDRLVEIYLQQAVSAFKRVKGDKPDEYIRLLRFLQISTNYRANRILPKLKDGRMPEAKAILLGRLGKHEEALRIYVFTLQNYAAAEAYCGRVYAQEPDPLGIFLLLLRIYLLPSAASKDPVLLDPALSLISTHGTRLDASKVLELLPPLVTMADVRAFFIKTLRNSTARKNDHRVVKSLVGARKEEVERVLMGLQVKRVRITDQRICPQCQKRLGTSAIAVHAPRGEVTHLHCKDIFSSRLSKQRS